MVISILYWRVANSDIENWSEIKRGRGVSKKKGCHH
jgi:hypothetical protein